MKKNANLSVWFSANYEKLALALSMLILLISALFLVTQVATERSSLNATSFNQPASGVSKADSVDAEQLNGRLNKLLKPVQINAKEGEMLVSELRVTCVNDQCRKPVPFHAENCPFCGTDQPSYNPDDRDGDGLPDPFEVRYGLDEYDPGDADKDLDNDGFTNMEEFTSKTDPSDPADTPPMVYKLRLNQVVTRPFKLRFQGVQELADGQRFLLNLRSLERSYFTRMGEEVEGFKVIDYEERKEKTPMGTKDRSILKLKQGDKVVELIKDQVLNKSELIAQLISLISDARYQVRLDDKIEVDGRTYSVVDIAQEQVELRGENDEIILVPERSLSETQSTRSGWESQRSLPMERGAPGITPAPPIRQGF